MKRTAERPLIVGHRGLKSASIPENSIEAFKAALHVGADAVECDIRLGSDGELFCRHDRLIDGHLAESLSSAQRQAAGLPLLSEVMQLLDHFPGKGLWIESKTPASAQALLAMHAPRPELVMISFSDQAVAQADQAGWDTVLLSSVGVDILRDLAPASSRFGPSVQLSFALSDQELGRASIWTVDDLAMAEALNRRSAWALTTNYPQQLLDFFS